MRGMNESHIARGSLFFFACAVAACSVAACSNPPPAAPPAPTMDPAAAPAPTAAAPAGPDAAAVEKCFATANVKRAKFSGEPAKIKVSHVLVKWKDAKNPAGATRSRAEACLRAIEARDKIRNGEDFSAVVKAYSDEPGAATRDGSIGEVERKDVLKPFADAAFELSVNQLSDVVETEFGFHVIFRTQ
jgi:peptidyl-prolyl cis-trans isomerase NIMA-interacting 1